MSETLLLKLNDRIYPLSVSFSTAHRNILCSGGLIDIYLRLPKTVENDFENGLMIL